MTSAEVLLIIAAFDGGFNGDVPGKEIDITVLSDTEATYTLHHWVNGARSGAGEQYHLTLTEETYVPPVNPGEDPSPAPAPDESFTPVPEGADPEAPTL